MLGFKYFGHGLPDAGDWAAVGVAFLLEGAKPDQPDGGGELRLIEGRLQPADGIGFAGERGQAEDAFGERLDVRNARAAAA